MSPCQTRFLRMDYADGLALLREEGIAADMVYLDLGVSSMQVDAWERGFSYSYDAPLDMRMDPGPGARRARGGERVGRAPAGAAFPRYGEERFARPIARAIVKRRGARAVRDDRRAGGDDQVGHARARAFAGGHPAKRVFQAIRIAVNDELGSLDRALPAAWELLRPGGRLAAISFHSLEDRRVKRFLADRARGCICPPDLPVCACGHEPEAELLTRRAVVPAPGEVADNPRAGSGKLRARPQAGGGLLMARAAAAARRRRRRAAHRARHAPAPRPLRAGAAAPPPPAQRGRAGPARRASSRALAALPRSPFVDRLLTGRVWIVLLGVLLAGIVFVNVALLEMNARHRAHDRAGRPP